MEVKTGAMQVLESRIPAGVRSTELQKLNLKLKGAFQPPQGLAILGS